MKAAKEDSISCVRFRHNEMGGDDVNTIGLDMGSAFIKGVLLCDDGRCFSVVEKSGRNYRETAERIYRALLEMADIKEAEVFSTGCGEGCISFPSRHVSEMAALVRAVTEQEHGPCIILDLGGQAGRLCVIDENDRVEAFDYSTKCASGSGKVLESVSRILQVPFEALSELGAKAQTAAAYTTSCAVFAESEAITAVARGESKESIIAGFHQSIAQKYMAMLNKHSNVKTVVAAGGMAKDQALLDVLGDMVQMTVKVAEEPQLCIARGAALLGRDMLP